MRKYLKIDIDMKSSSCLKTRIFKNAAWAEMRQLFQNRDMFENENQFHLKIILTPYYFKVDISFFTN